MLKKLKYFLYRLKVRGTHRAQSAKRNSLFINNTVSSQKRLLLVKLDSIGDYILMRNFIKEIKTSGKYKDHEITLCGNLWWKDLSEELDSTYISDFVWIDYTRLDDFDYSISISEKLYAKNFDVAVTPTFSRSTYTDELMLQSGAKIKIAPLGDTANIPVEIKAVNDARYSELIAIDNTLGFEFERYRSFFNKLTGSTTPLEQLFITHKKTTSAKIVICPGAKELKRQWAPANFYKVAVFIQNTIPGAEFYICGSGNETQLADAIIASGNPVTFTNLCGKINLVELKDLIAGSRLVLCNDSAPYHLAASLDVPLVCLSNGNHYQRFCPYPKTYKKKNIELFPPALKEETLTEKEIKDLQLNGSNLNINDITAEQVIEKISESGFLK